MNNAIVISDIASLYVNPDTKSELADEALFGMTVEITGDKEDFFRVRTHYRYEGFAPKACFLTESNAAELWNKREKQVVVHPYLDILAEPDVCAAKLVSIPRGGLASVVSFDAVNDEGFIKVCLPDGREGFTKPKCLGKHITSWSKQNEDGMRDAIVETATSYMGAQYRWGGKSPLGIDCSGLTSMAYMLNGSIIYRDARIVDGFDIREIPREQMKKADLLYFKGHIAMYTGDGMYIHATAHKSAFGVTVNSLDSAHTLYRADLAEGILAVGSIF